LILSILAVRGEPAEAEPVVLAILALVQNMLRHGATPSAAEVGGSPRLKV